MSISGTGTQADPFIVDTVKDLRAKMTVSNAYIKLACDLNCDDEMEYWSGVTSYCTEINLDGHTIKNINITPTGNNYFIYSNKDSITIKNGTLQSIIATNLKYLIQATSEGFGSSDIYLQNVKLSGIITMSGSSRLFDSSHQYHTKSAFNLKVVSNGSAINMFDDSFTDCNVRLDYNGLGNIGGSFVNSKIAGTYHCGSTDTTRTEIFIGTVTSSVIACAISTGGSKIKICDTANGVNIVDSSLITATLDSTPTNINLLTTEQCKSATYLNSIGFTVFEE